MKQSAEHDWEFSLSSNLRLKKIYRLVFESSAFKQTDKNSKNWENRLNVKITDSHSSFIYI
jgi:hypothetical protein